MSKVVDAKQITFGEPNRKRRWYNYFPRFIDYQPSHSNGFLMLFGPKNRAIVTRMMNAAKSEKIMEDSLNSSIDSSFGPLTFEVVSNVIWEFSDTICSFESSSMAMVKSPLLDWRWNGAICLNG